MSTLASMRKLTRTQNGQISVSSDPSIKADLKRAEIDLWGVQMMAEPVDQAHLVNAWVWGIARLPEPARAAITEAFVRDLERWRLEQPQATPDELLAAVREAVAEPSGPTEIRPLPGSTFEAGRNAKGKNKPPVKPRTPKRRF